MGQLTPEFLFDLESNMRVISANEYQRLTSNLWWNLIAKRMPSSAKKERINWLLDSAKIERTTKGGGQVPFEDVVMQTTEYENENAAAGLEIKKEEFEDLDGNGVQLATHWSRQMGAYAAYWPQKVIAKAILANGNTYDGLSFFNAAHPVNPFKASAGTFANDLTGAANGIYPGAVPIGGTTTVDDALDNLRKVIAYIASIKMPNGEDPRMLRVKHIFVPPNLLSRAQQLTDAKLIAQATSGGGAASADVAAIISGFGLVPEFGSAFGGSDTTYYIGVEEITTSELGAFTYVDREPFSIVMHGEMTDAQLARTREFQWTTEGRNTVGNGHPYLLFRCQGT